LSSTPLPTEVRVHAVDARPAAILMEEVIREQSNDPACQLWLTTTAADTLFDTDESGLLVRIAPLDKSRQIVVPAALQPRLFHLEIFLQTAGHLGLSRMIPSMRHRFFWPRLAAAVIESVRQCTTCAKNRIKERSQASLSCSKHRTPLSTWRLTSWDLSRKPSMEIDSIWSRLTASQSLREL
jgi:Integrase zinc binding domain